MNDVKFDNEVLTVSDTAKYLKICRVNAYALFKCKNFPSFKIGKSKRVLKSDLLYFVQNTLMNKVN